jgi:DNA-binding NarL/FixJ family response regulator
VAFLRRRGRPPFSGGHKTLLHVVMTSVAALHRPASEFERAPWVQSLGGRSNLVLSLLVCGYSRKQVAHELGLSLHTVNDHVKVIHRVCGVSSNAELLVKYYGHDCGLTPPHRQARSAGAGSGDRRSPRRLRS